MLPRETGGSISDDLLKRVQSTVRNNPAKIRKILSYAMGDEAEIKAIEYEELLSEITRDKDEKRYIENLPVKDRMKLASRTENKTLREELLNGKGSDETLIELDKSYRNQIAVLKSQNTKLINKYKERLKSLEDRFEYKSKRLEEIFEKLAGKEKENRALQTDVRKLKDRIIRIKNLEKRRREIKNIRDYKLKLAARIMRAPAKGVFIQL